MRKSSVPQWGQVIKTLRTKSAVNPALIFALICLASGVAGLAVGQERYFDLFQWVIILGVGIPAFQIIFFTLFDRNRLHDEKHVENRMIIEALTPMLGDASNVVEIEAEPVLRENPALEDGRDV